MYSNKFKWVGSHVENYINRLRITSGEISGESFKEKKNLTGWRRNSFLEECCRKIDLGTLVIFSREIIKFSKLLPPIIPKSLETCLTDSNPDLFKDRESEAPSGIEMEIREVMTSQKRSLNLQESMDVVRIWKDHEEFKSFPIRILR